jgi:2-keto-3-deoxy-L-rhamnonate aldolase RhmA
LVRFTEDITTIQQYAYYPPKGQRGLGGERNVKWGLGLEEYTSNANDDIMIIPVIETKDASEAIDDILELEGIETILFGPGDLSSSYGYLGQWEGPGMEGLILEMKEKASKHGIGSAVLARNTEDAKLRRDQGFAMVGLGSDAGMVVRHVGKLLADLGVKEIDHRWF